jgi:hypothetical protein
MKPESPTGNKSYKLVEVLVDGKVVLVEEVLAVEVEVDVVVVLVVVVSNVDGGVVVDVNIMVFAPSRSTQRW